MGHYLAGEEGQRARLLRSQRPGRMIHHTKSSQHLAARSDQRRTRVEPDKRLPGHQRVGGKSIIAGGIRYHQGHLLL